MKRGDRPLWIAASKHIDNNAHELFFISLEELDTILLLIMFLLIFGQHSRFTVVEYGKQLSVVLVVEVVVLVAQVVPSA